MKNQHYQKILILKRSGGCFLGKKITSDNLIHQCHYCEKMFHTAEELIEHYDVHDKNP